MTQTELWVNRTNYRDTRFVQTQPALLSDGEIRVAITKFALTSNNVSYAVSGDMIGYWNYFPTGEEGWGKVTVWGVAKVIESNHSDIQVGEQIQGFFPMVTHLVLCPCNIKQQRFDDGLEHRLSLPALYNRYNRCQAEPDFMKALEDERCILFPLYITGYVIADFLFDNAYFSAEQIIIGSVSSKTAYSLAAFLQDSDYTGRVIGLTSPANVEFVNQLNVCDQVVPYDSLNTIENTTSVYVDMSGNKAVLSTLHHHLGDNMKSSQIVGVTHWDNAGNNKDLPGAQPVLFFTPGQIDKRNKELGLGVLTDKAFIASTELAHKFKQLIATEYHHGIEAADTMWHALLDNDVSGQRGIMIVLEG